MVNLMSPKEDDTMIVASDSKLPNACRSPTPAGPVDHPPPSRSQSQLRPQGIPQRAQLDFTVLYGDGSMPILFGGGSTRHTCSKYSIFDVYPFSEYLI